MKDRMTTLRLLFCLTAFFLFAVSCSKSGPPVASSGDDEFDKTASFILYSAKELKKRPKFENPSDLAGYMTSAQGLGEIIPPSVEFEPDAAERYNGPRPSDTISFYKERFTTWETPGQIVVEGDDANRKIVATAYRGTDETPFFTWNWDFDNLAEAK